MNTIAFAILSVTALGVLCAIMLSVAAKIMAVEIDEKVTKILECLPGVNCGACGFSGCASYAEALVSDGDTKSNLCLPGGVSTTAVISEILGVSAIKMDMKFAVVHCLGDSEATQKRMDYKGVPSCVAATDLFGGDGSCPFGCLGYGDCASACPSGAICIENGIAVINTNLCMGCGLCTRTCPKKLITIESADARVWVLCHSTEKGADTRKSCTKGCIGCSRCVRECPSEAIHVEGNLARIDDQKCTNCGSCADVCVTHCIKTADRESLPDHQVVI